ncbi:uncharacterized protein TNCV_4485061 [Trichonephila clavipes]|nr:uncharacterized protein TNCV_4485061 [Trichonephila clavipes]
MHGVGKGSIANVFEFRQVLQGHGIQSELLQKNLLLPSFDHYQAPVASGQLTKLAPHAKGQNGAPRFEPGPSRSAVECSTTELYTPRQRTFCFAFRRSGYENAFPEIYREWDRSFYEFLHDARSPSQMHANTFMIPMRSHTDA